MASPTGARMGISGFTATATSSSPGALLRDVNTGNVNSILSYLDEVDKASMGERPRSPSEESRQSAIPMTALRRSYPASEAGLSALSLTGRENVFYGIKNKIEALRVENAELKQSVDRLKSRLSEREGEYETERNRFREAARHEFDGLRETMQKAIDEHLRCIKRLITDKDQMVKVTQELTVKVAQSDSLHADEMRKVEAAHAAALNELKGKLSLQEKTRREQWTVKEAKRIKESTLKAMEPDIALLMNRHKAEKRRLEEEYTDALRRKDDQLLLKERELAETKLRLGKDMEELMIRERTALRGHVGDEARRMERLFDDERAALKAQHALEIRDLHDRIARLQAQIAEQHHTMSTMNKAEDVKLREARAATAEAIDKLHQQHRLELADLQARRETEAADFEKVLAKRVDEAVEARMQVVVQRVETEKNQAIATAVSRMENEQLRAMKEMRAKEKQDNERYEAVSRERDRLRRDIETLESSLVATKEGVKVRDATTESLRAELEDVKTRLKDIRSQCDSELGERLRALDGAWRARTAALENEHVAVTEQHRMDVLKLEKAAERDAAERQAQCEAAERRHTTELTAINERVLSTIARKDQQIRQLTETVQGLEAQLRAREMEMERHQLLLMAD